jgi:expansin (peptidoglycan-binding protein)
MVAKIAFAFIVALALTSAATAQHRHGDHKGPSGGQVLDVADVEAELVTSGNTITINVFDESHKPLATKGFTASALVVRGSGAEREIVSLAPAGENALKGDAKKPVAGAAITITMKTAAGKSGQARFKP